MGSKEGYWDYLVYLKELNIWGIACAALGIITMVTLCMQLRRSLKRPGRRGARKDRPLMAVNALTDAKALEAACNGEAELPRYVDLPPAYDEVVSDEKDKVLQ